jgi:hypothetical protein
MATKVGRVLDVIVPVAVAVLEQDLDGVEVWFVTLLLPGSRWQ